MSTSHQHQSGHNDFTDSDVRIRPLIVAIFVCLLVAGLTITGINLLMHHFNDEAKKADDFTNIYSLQRQIPEGGAILQGFQAAARDLAKLHADEQALLTRYEWVDKPAGTLRIPIDQAMVRAVEKGYPVRETPAP